MYDVFHALKHPRAVLAEMYRVLKPGGTLSFSDHHLGDAEIVSGVTDGGLFALAERGDKTYAFIKCG